MHRLIHFVSRCLLLVMLATVFSPSFGWEAVEGMAAHEESEAVHATHHARADQATEDVTGDVCAGHEVGASDLEHHCCPGHVLGHLLGSLAASGLPILPLSGKLAVNLPDARFSSRVPEGLERPPKTAA